MDPPKKKKGKAVNKSFDYDEESESYDSYADDDSALNTPQSQRSRSAPPR